jgi:rare lipoprotein A (peptidoglycan hydrolase)
MLVAVPPAQPAVPLAADAIVEKVHVRPPRHTVRARAGRHRAGHHRAGHHRAGHGGAYHLAGASWYGGGGSLACGGTLTSSTRGVANKTLPCGTVVFLRYHGHKVEVPVIDRGPFVAGREFDLTEATKRALGFGDTGEVWWRVR